jgi:O-antigen/teichoic acid export membrane protein
LTWASGAVYTAITVAVGLVATPQIVAALGESRFGAFRAITDWMGYLLLADLGLGSAFAVALVRANVEGAERAAAVLRQGFRILARITVVAVALGAVLAWQMPALVLGEGGIAPELRAGAAVTAIGLALTPLLIFRSYLESAQRGYLINIALLAQSLVVTALSVLLAWSGGGIVGQSVAALAGLVLFTGLMVVWARPLLRRHPRTAEQPFTTRQLWSLSWPLAAASAGNRLNLMTDTIVVGRLLGAADVAALFLTQRIILLCAGQVNGLASSSWAALADLRQRGESAAFEARLSELTRLAVGLGIVIVGSIAAFDEQFVSLWVGPRLYAGDLLALATLGSAVLFAFLLPYSWAIDMAGDTRHRLVVSSIGSVLNLTLSIVFVRRLGLPGVALGTLFAYLLTDAWYCPWLVVRRYGVRASSVVSALGRGLGAGIPWLALVWTLARIQPPVSGWTMLLGEAAVVGAAAVLYCWCFVLSGADRTQWSNRLRGAIGR